MDISKLTSKEFNDKIDKQVAQEKLSEIPEQLIQFSNNRILNYCLAQKTGLKEKPTPRVLNNWVQNGIVSVDERDKGKIKRFDKLESIWLNIVVELREFGVSIDCIKRTRNLLFNNIFNNFSLFKFHVLNSILRTPQTLVIFKNGSARIMSSEIYIETLKNERLLPHLSFQLIDFIESEYPYHSLTQNFKITAPLESIEKMKLLFFLKTGDYLSMRIKLSDGDVRYIENNKILLKNNDILSALIKWEFDEIIINIDNETDTIITSK